ncbi:MAG: NDP-sugar synthase [Methanomassiliicoccales archaeon]|nr:MAG: NDP-sugar synthase [Methanomassiliicoccales archaeon]
MSLKVRQAVIMAGGEGTRLRPLTNTRPKPLLPVLGRPCIEYTIRSMVNAGVEEVFLALGYRANDIVAALGDGEELGAKIRYSFEEEPMGTAGAVKLLEDRLDDVFMVGSGDTLTDADLSSLVAMHFNRSAMATMGLTEVERPEQFGIVGISSDGRVQRFKEKPRPEEVFSNVINSGTYVLSKKILELVPEGRKYDFSKDLFPDVLARGLPLYATRLEGYWKDIGRPHDLLEANLKMAEMQGEPTFIPGLTTEGPIVARDASGEGGMVVGPSFLDDGSWIGKGATVASSCLGKGVLIEGAAVVRSSLLLDGCIVSEAASVTDCVIGKNCVIGKGVSLSNSVLGDDVVIEGPQKLEGVTRQTEDPQRSC